MTADDLDQILTSDEMLEPSSGFVVSVMESIRRQANEPAPRGFPWLRFAIGLIGWLVMAASGGVLLLRLKPALTTLSAPLAFLGRVAPQLGYAVAALLLSFAIVSFRKLRSTV
jgi:hypothetical protein